MRKIDASGEVLVERTVQLLGRRQVAPERLLDDDPGVWRSASTSQPFHDHAEQAGRDGQVVERTLRAAERRGQLLKVVASR